MPMKTLNNNPRGATGVGHRRGPKDRPSYRSRERGTQVIASDLTPPNGTVEKIDPAAHAVQLDVTQEGLNFVGR